MAEEYEIFIRRKSERNFGQQLETAITRNKLIQT